MSVVDADFGRATEKRDGINFCFRGILYNLKMHEDGVGNLRGINLTCPGASSGMQALAAGETKRISEVLDCGVALSSMLSGKENRIHRVQGHGQVKTAETVADAVLQMLISKYERPANEPKAKQTAVSFLQVHNGGMA